MIDYQINKLASIYLSKKDLTPAVVAFDKLVTGGKKYFSLAFIGSGEMRKLNRQWRGINKPTDVLSFSEKESEYVEDEKYLGEIIICVDVAKKQAKEQSISIKNEIQRLLVHGLAHLAGYDHEKVSKNKKREMEQLESAVMSMISKE